MATSPKFVDITLAEPIKIDGKDVFKIKLRKPETGELRGLKLFNVLHMDTNAMFDLIPRLTDPYISEDQLAKDVAPEDFMEMTAKVLAFLSKGPTGMPPVSP